MGSAYGGAKGTNLQLQKPRWNLTTLMEELYASGPDLSGVYIRKYQWCAHITGVATSITAFVGRAARTHQTRDAHQLRRL
jgi:hypothetical protein